MTPTRTQCKFQQLRFRNDQVSSLTISSVLIPIATMSEISSLQKRRDDLLECISAISLYVDEYEKSGGCNADLLKTYKKKIDDAWSQVTVAQKELVDVNEEKPTDVGDAQQKYCALDERLTKLIDSVPLSPTPTPTNSGVSSAVARPMSIKLPILQIPTFDGTIENWSSFYQIFHVTIDQNNELTPVEKLYYLRALLTGKAAKSIESLGSSENDYSNAIATLKEKFHYPGYICLRHWNEILKYPKLTKETPEAIGNLIDRVNMHLRMLKNLGQPITSDVVIIGVLLSKLSPKIIHQWELTLPDKNLPSYSHLLDFLKTRANCSMFVTANEKRGALKQHPRLQRNAPRCYTNTATNFTPKCPICRESHKVWNCNTFIAKPVKERITAATKTSLCTNCLRKGHISTECFAIGRCHVCGQRHHTLLHLYKTEFRTRTVTNNRR